MRRGFTLSGVGLGLFLILLGLAFLSDSASGTSYFSTVFDFYPLLAILLGLDFIFNSAGGPTPLIKRPEGWAATLIIIITICGLSITMVPRVLGDSWKEIADFDLSRISFGSWNFDLQSEKTIRQDFQLPAGTTTLRLENEFGDLEVRAGTGNLVSATADLKIFKPNRETAEAQEAVQLSGYASGDRFLVKLLKPDYTGGRVQSRITLTVPPNLAVELKNSFGNINVIELKGGLKVENSNGRINIGRVTGDAIINNQFAGVTIGAITGNLEINVNAGGIGIEQVGKNLTARNDFGRLKVDSVGGDFLANCKNSRIEAGKILGKARIENAFGGVTLKDCQGPVEAELSNGNLEVGISQITGPSSFDIQFGNIRVALPSGAKFTLDAATSFGKILTGYPLEPTGASRGPAGESLSGDVNGGGPLIQLRAKNGNISID
ncbi:MAG: DUF4097 family beta strand repeat-containing protein [Firmicutes bacterium]|nr:DUF4097 family beta strand repeat-containing protein [Bacillota bacterium]